MQNRCGGIHIQATEITEEQQKASRGKALQQQLQYFLQGQLIILESKGRAGIEQGLNQRLHCGFPHDGFKPAGFRVQDQPRHRKRMLLRLPGMAAGQSSRQRNLELPPGSETHACPPVHQQEQAGTPFLPEHPGVEFARAGVQAPVQQARLIAGLIGTVLLEIQPLSTKSRERITKQRLGGLPLEIGQGPGQGLNMIPQFQPPRCIQQGRPDGAGMR